MKLAIIAVGAVVFLATAAGSAELPWFERYFFPIGMWCMPTNDQEDWLDDDGAGGLSINDWTPPDYANIAAIEELKFDYGRVAVPMNWDICTSAEWRDHRLFDYDADGVPDTTEADLWAVEDLKEIGVRSFLKIFDLNFYNSAGKECLAGECGGQDPTYPDKKPYNDEVPCVPGNYDDYKVLYEDNFIDDYTEKGFEDLFDGYREAPVAAIMMDDEPRHWELLRSRVLADLYHEHDAGKILMSHLEDRTLFQCGVPGDYGFGVPGIDNFYSFANCHIGEKILCGLTHHMKNITYANSSNLYNGYFDPPENPWSEPHHGFPSMEGRLSRAREASLEYNIPYWYVPSADYVYNYFPEEPGCKRWKSPREVRANVNMSLTYGAKGIVYLGMFLPPPPPEGPNHYETILDNHGNLVYDNDSTINDGKYRLVIGYENGEPILGDYIEVEDLYNEFVSLHTKLYSVRNTLQTLTSLSAFHSFNLDNELPRGLIYDYEGNRNDRQWYSPDYTEETDFLDFGTFVCPYTGVRYFAVSDRFCNWPPATFPDPTEHDVVTVRHPGRSLTDVYYDLDDMPYNDIYIPVEGWDHDSGVSEFDFRLDNADGRIFKLDPCLTLAPGFEYVENPDNVWDFDGGQGWIPTVVDDVSRKGNNSLRLQKNVSNGDWTVVNETKLNIAGVGVGPFDVAPGATYRASAYIKADLGWEGYAKVQVAWLNMYGESIGLLAETPPVSGGTNWAADGWVYTYVDFKLEDIPPAAKKIGLVFALVSGDGTVWFDEVRLEPLSRVFNGHFEWDGGDWWPNQAFGWGWPIGDPNQKYWRVSPGYESDYCLKVGAKNLVGNVVRNDEKLYLGKGTNYAVTGRAKRGLTSPGVDAEAVVEFYTNKDVKFKTKSFVVPAVGGWHYFNILIKPEDWEVPNPDDGTPGYVRIGCKMEAGVGDALFDNIELIETNRVPNGSFELAEEGPHWPDRWDYVGIVPQPDPGDPMWSALYDADARYDRRCWRVRGPEAGNINYGSETFPLYANTSYRLSGWIRSFDVDNRIDEGCYLKLDFYDVWGNSVDSYETDVVASEEDWTYEYVDFTIPDEGPGGEIISGFGRVTVVEEGRAYSSAADGIRVLPVGIVE
jgi:hypothetical protein